MQMIKKEVVSHWPFIL